MHTVPDGWNVPDMSVQFKWSTFVRIHCFLIKSLNDLSIVRWTVKGPNYYCSALYFVLYNSVNICFIYLSAPM